jgi:TolB-like protein/Tfp pilus assembly protein PilF
MALVGFALWRAPRHAETPPAKTAPISVAVLPFLNLTGSTSREYLSDGFTEELTTELARSSRLRVVARTSAFQFRGKSEDVRTIGKQLGVGAVVEGSLALERNRLHITAQVVSTETGYDLWSGAFDGERSEIYSLEQQLVEQAAKALGVPPGNAEQMRPRPHTENPEAHDLYLEGRYHWYRRSLPDMQTSIRLFDAATKKDPEYALAYLGLAETYVVMAGNGQAPYSQVMPLARTALSRAMKLDPLMADAHVTMAMLVPPFGDQKEKEREFRRAVELSPGYANAHHWFGVILSAMARFQEADTELRQAQLLDPLSPMVTEGLAENLYYWRRYDEAIEQVGRIRARGSDLGDVILGLAYIQKHMYPEAIAVFQDLSHGQEANKMQAYLACAYAAAGQTDTARKLLQGVEAPGRAYVPPSVLARAHVLLGERNAALQLLERGYEQSDPTLALKVDPIFDPIRSEPRYLELLRKMDLAQ